MTEFYIRLAGLDLGSPPFEDYGPKRENTSG